MRMNKDNLLEDFEGGAKHNFEQNNTSLLFLIMNHGIIGKKVIMIGQKANIVPLTREILVEIHIE